jgi:hypothetical protein
MDCGSRADTDAPCERCQEPRLDLRKAEVKLACLEDDERRRSAREQRLLWISIPIALVLVEVLQELLGEWAALVPLLKGFFGFIVWGIVLALGLWKGLGRVFPAERRFPYLAAHQLAEPLTGIAVQETVDYRNVAPPGEPPRGGPGS